MTEPGSLDLEQLAADYDIRGELAGRDDARVFLGRRRADDRSVLVTVFHQPRGDRGASLGHLASDAKILADRGHPNVLGVLEGRWVGAESFAIVTERPAAASLDDVLTRRDEAFEFPRIASILRQVNAALEWARESGVAHRVVRPDAIFLDAGSDHVRVFFAPGQLPTNGMPGAVEDAASLAQLARAILTRSTTAPERDRQPLAEMRPGLPRRVVEQTEALLRVDDEASEPAVDPREYIAGIAMAEELKRGEVECDRTIAEMTEEQRVTREQLAAERQAHEADLAEQSRKFAAEKEAAEKAFEKQKEELVRAFSEQSEDQKRAYEKRKEELERALAKDRETLTAEIARERKALMDEIARERKAIEKERARLAKERTSLTKRIEAFEREAEKGRAQIASKIAALTAHAKLYDQTAELPIPAADRELPPVIAYEPLVADEREPATEEPWDEIVEEEQDLEMVAEEARPAEPHPMDVVPDKPVSRAPWWRRAWERRTRRSMGIAAVALVGVIGASALAFGRDGDASAPVEALVQDSAAGQVAPTGPIVIRNLTPTTSVDTSTPASVAERPRRTGTASPAVEQRPEPVQEPLGDPFPQPYSTPPVTTQPVPPATPVGVPTPTDTISRPDTTPLGPRPLGTPTPAVSRDSATPAPVPAFPLPALPVPRDTTRPDSLTASGH